MSSKRKFPNRPESEASIRAREEAEKQKKIKIVKVILGIICAVGGITLGLFLGGVI